MRRWEGENLEGGRQREEGEKVRRWEGENLEGGLRQAQASQSRNAAFEKLRRGKVGIQGPTAANQYRIPNTEYRTPIIAMTAHAMSGDEQKSIEAGMNDHVTKPINPDQLFATLQKWINPVAERTAEQHGPPEPNAPPEPDGVGPDEDELPESLPGFDLAAGLARLRGNKRLYRKLLLDFGADYRGVANDIREALAVGDFEQAHSLVHNLKGLAGNLEASELQMAAVEMETLVKGPTAQSTSEEKLERKFVILEKAINRALKAVQTLGPLAEEENNPPPADWLAEVPEEQLADIVNRIKTAADMGDVMQIQAIADELKSANDAMAPFSDELVKLAEDFDFDGIQKLMPELDG